MFAAIDKRNSILKNGGKRSFFNKTKASMSFIPMSKMTIWYPIVKKKEDHYVNLSLSNKQMNFDSKKWSEDKFFL